jgi:hypothetical protein
MARANVQVLISHAHDEKAYADAWKNLLSTVSLGGIEVWFRAMWPLAVVWTSAESGASNSTKGTEKKRCHRPSQSLKQSFESTRNCGARVPGVLY